jgi:hypothetical protein
MRIMAAGVTDITRGGDFDNFSLFLFVQSFFFFLDLNLRDLAAMNETVMCAVCWLVVLYSCIYLIFSIPLQSRRNKRGPG